MTARRLSRQELRSKVRKRKASSRRKKLKLLLSAALAIPGLGLPSDLHAQSIPAEGNFRFQYVDYQEYQKGREDRMRVRAPMVWLQAPIGEADVVETSLVYDSMSGASPFYLSALSGASGEGVNDIRRAADLKLTHYFDRFSLGAGGMFSHEDDYDSKGGIVEAKWWSEDKNTIFNVGVGANLDDISSSDNLEFRDQRRSINYLLGVTQVINPVSIIQSNLTLTSGEGYFSDPYKLLDNRPHSRDQFAWLTRYNLFVPPLDASLHTDYRYYWDSWDIQSHMLELAWYQAIGESWILRPNVRYYSQSAADFFETSFPPADLNSFYSADQRVGDFGSITTGLRLIRSFSRNVAFDVGFDFMQQRPGFKLGSHEGRNIEPFYARIISVGILAKF